MGRSSYTHWQTKAVDMLNIRVTLLGKVSVTPVNRGNAAPNVPGFASLYLSTF